MTNSEYITHVVESAEHYSKAFGRPYVIFHDAENYNCYAYKPYNGYMLEGDFITIITNYWS